MEAEYWAIKKAEYNLSGQGLTREQTVEYHERFNAGIAWFRMYYPKEYMSLLDYGVYRFLVGFSARKCAILPSIKGVSYERNGKV